MAEITQEQVGELTRHLNGARYDCGDNALVLMRRSQVAHVLALLRLATPELVALGEAAVPFGQAHAAALAEGYDSQWQEVERTRHALCEAARLYAQSIKGEDHGK